MGKDDSILTKRLEIVKTAKEIGITKAAELYNYSRKTVGKWLKEYESGGKSALANKSRKNQLQPNKMPASVLEQIVLFKDKNPSYSARKIKEALGLDYSVTVINKKLREAVPAEDQSIVKNDNIIAQYSPFSKIAVTVMKNNDHDTDIYSDDLPEYRFIAEDQLTKIQFVAYSYEKTELDLAIFIDYLLVNFRTAGVDTALVSFSIGEYYLSCKKSMLEHIVSVKHKAILCCTKGTPGGRHKKFDLMHENLDKNSRITNDNILHFTYAYLIYFNYLKLSRFLKNSSMNTSGNKDAGKILNRVIHLIPPIVTDMFIKHISEIKKDQTFWLLDSQCISSKNDVIEKAIKHLEKIGSLAGKSYKSSKAIDFFNTILSSLEFTDNISFRIVILQKKGIIYQRIGKWKKAEGCYQRALILSRKIKDQAMMKKTYGLLGIQLYLAGDHLNAMKYYSKQLRLAREFGDKKEISTALLSLGVLNNELGKYQKSLKHYDEVIQICDETGDKLKQAKALGNIGVIYYKKGQQTKAMEYYTSAYDLSRELGDKRQVSRLSSNMGAIYEDNGDYEQAMECYQVLAKVSLELENMQWYLAAVSNIGNLFLNIGKYEKALSNFNKLSETAHDMGDDEKLSISYANTAEVYKAIGKLKEADHYIDKAIDLAGKIRNQYYLCSYYNTKSYIALERNKLKNAANFNEIAYKTAVEVERKDLLFEIKLCELRITYKQLIDKKGESFILIIEELLAMLNNEKDHVRKAALQYELYKLYKALLNLHKNNNLYNSKANEHGAAAHVIYRSLYKKTPRILYCDRMNELERSNDKGETYKLTK